MREREHERARGREGEIGFGLADLKLAAVECGGAHCAHKKQTKFFCTEMHLRGRQGGTIFRIEIDTKYESDFNSENIRKSN